MPIGSNVDGQNVPERLRSNARKAYSEDALKKFCVKTSRAFAKPQAHLDAFTPGGRRLAEEAHRSRRNAGSSQKGRGRYAPGR